MGPIMIQTAYAGALATQLEKAKRFRVLDARESAFVIPNPWVIGFARLPEGLGYETLATTRSGFAHSLGRPDGDVTQKRCSSTATCAVRVLNGKVGSHVQQRPLAHLAIDAFGLDQPIREVALAVGTVPRCGPSDKPTLVLPRNSRESISQQK